MKTLVQYCMDLRYRRPTKTVIARRAVEIGRLEGMNVEINAAEAMAESCGNDIRQVLNSLQMWSCKKKKADCGGGGADGGGTTGMTYRDLKERQNEINKDEVLRVSMFDACRTIVEGSRGLAGADPRAVTASLMKRTDAFFVDYMMMGLMVHQNYLKVCMGAYNGAKLGGDADVELSALDRVYEAAAAMSDFGMCEESLRGGDQNWSLLPLCSVLAVKVGHHAGGPTGGFLSGYPEFAGWLGKNSTRNKKIRLLQEFRHHMNYKVSADAPELRMNYLPIIRQQLEELLFHKDGAMVTDAIALMDDYGLDRDDVFENFDEFLFNSKELKVKKFGDLDSKSKSAFTRAYNSMAHKAQALVSEQGAEKIGRKKTASGGGEMMDDGVELDVVNDDKAAAEEESDDEEDDDDLETLKKKFLKKGASKANGKKGKKK
jgi:replication factor C subunit 1